MNRLNIFLSFFLLFQINIFSQATKTVAATPTLNLAFAAFDLTKQKVTYTDKYYKIKYPDGDIPANKGMAADVIVRAYRKLGIDLQKEVHEDMEKNFDKYPKDFGLKKPDANIDHRRVLNLMTFFQRKGKDKLISNEAIDYLPGDIVCWNLTGDLPHIGIVVDKKSEDKERYLIVHNNGAGQQLADCLFTYKIIGHYRYKAK